MRIYGTETMNPKLRTDWCEPDCGDIKNHGLASAAGHLPGKGGDIRSCHRSAAAKAAARRVLKRRARNEGKRACRG